MDKPGVQSSVNPQKKILTRANSTISPTNKSWRLTQMPQSKLCRCNSVLAPKNQFENETQNYLDGPASLDYPFFPTKLLAKNVISDNSLWTKEFWSDKYNRLHCSTPDFEKFPSSQPGVSTIYNPQFLSSKMGYNSSHISGGNQERKKEKWPGQGNWLGDWQCQFSTHWPNISSSQKLAAILCALVLTLLASGNIIYILQKVQKPAESPNKSVWVDVVLVSGEFNITNEPYRETLSNQSSADFQNLSGLITHQLDNLFSLSVLSESYHSTMVKELTPGLLVSCQLVLRASRSLTASLVGLTFIGGLRNQHGHVWLGNFSIDIQSIGFKASSDAVSWSGWSEWGACQHLQELGFVQVRYRNCTLRSGQNLSNTLPCLLVPQHQGNLETEPCESQEGLMSVETSKKLTNNLSKRSERITDQVKITREDCNTKYKTEPISLSSAAVVNVNKTTAVSGQPTTNLSTPCICGAGTVCIALDDQASASCLPVLDGTDPTGCGGHCKLNTQLCHNIRDNVFRCIDDSKCLEDEWQCGNQLCIPRSNRCDGHFNCYDHTDEQNCDCNSSLHFQCGKRMSCLPLAKRCDAVVDCWDATDELNCTIHCVGVDQFTCNDSQCIPNHRFCDGFPDCKDLSDEPFGCGGECKTHEFKCRNTRCVAQSKRCDRVDDCGDQSDEIHCPIVTPD